MTDQDERCTCDDFGECACPRHAADNAAQDHRIEVAELRARVVELEAEAARLRTQLAQANSDADAWAQIAGSIATDSAMAELHAKAEALGLRRRT